MIISLPNGMVVHGLNKKDTIMMFEDIFVNKCYGDLDFNADGLIVDIGANIGMFALFVLDKWKGKEKEKGRLVCFEPIKEIFDCLEKNVKLNFPGIFGVKLVNKGVGDINGIREINYFPDFPSASGIIDRWDKEILDSFIEKGGGILEKLDWIIRKIGILKGIRRIVIRRMMGKSRKVDCEFVKFDSLEKGKIDLVKIDVEGSELAVLRGMTKRDWSRVERMIVETHDAFSENWVWELMKENGIGDISIKENSQVGKLKILFGKRCP